MKVRRRNNKRVLYVGLGIFVAVFLFSFLTQRFKSGQEVGAASLAAFDPGYIISDYQMSNYNSMSETEIQSFLTSKNSCNNRDYEVYQYIISKYPSTSWHWNNGHFVCLSEERFGDGETIGLGDTAAHIIWQAAQDYRINPQVLIVLLQKEQGLITDDAPNSIQYRSATGYGCPDTAPCSSQYYGFKNQVRKAAAMFRTVLDGGWTNYPLGNNYIQYNPNAGCGGSVVNIRSLATSALYRYTPYQPNAEALAAGYGTAYCGAYGNRNFYLFFEDWFGGITNTSVYYEIEQIIDIEVRNGISAGSRILVDKNSRGGYYALYTGGVFYVVDGAAPVFVKSGAVRDLYRMYGLENGELGYPISNEKDGLKEGASYQLFENAVVYSHPTLGTYVVKSGAVRDLYRMYGLENGELGYPISNEKGGTQRFQNRTIMGETLYTEQILKEYLGNRMRYGIPMSNVRCGLRNDGCFQVFTGGIVYSSINGVFIVENGEILEQYRQQDRENGIGYPINNMENGKQQFENGALSN